MIFNELKQSTFFMFYRIFDCSDHVASLFTASNVLEIQVLSAALLAKLLSSDVRLLQLDEASSILNAIPRALARLSQVHINKHISSINLPFAWLNAYHNIIWVPITVGECNNATAVPAMSIMMRSLWLFLDCK